MFTRSIYCIFDGVLIQVIYLEFGDDYAGEIALLFYAYLNDKSDEFLETHNYSRDEIKDGLKEVTIRYGVDGFADILL